ncbi:hypothetical protein ABPG75_001063 [Micractinium tetrahymenae]
MAAPPAAAAVGMLEVEFRALAQEARSKEGLAGFFSSTADQQAVKDAAERVILKVRSCGEAPDAMGQIKTHYQEVLRPLQLSLETKSDRLKSRALAIAQNLIANHALPAEASEAVVAMLGRVDRNTDENVQLKTLQTALTLLQSPLRPYSEEQIGAVLGVCLRLTNKKGHKDAVLTTAAATVRQAVALVLSYVDVEAELQGQQLEGSGETSAPGGAAAAAQKLVEDLCNIASGVPPLWLKSPSLPRTFVLELLEFLLVNSPAVFRQLPPFQNALAVRMTQLIQAQLQDHLDAGAAGASFATTNFSTFRALLRLARTLLRNFYPLLGPRSGALVQALLAGLAPRYPLYHRIALMQLVRTLLADPLLAYHLFATYDLAVERKLDAVQSLCRAAGEVVDATLKAVNKDPEDEPPLDVVAVLYSDKTAGKDWTLDTDFEAAGQQVQRGFLGMLAIDSLLAFMGSVEKLTDYALDQSGDVPAALSKGPGSVERVDVDVVKAMVDRTWRGLLSAISQLLQRSSGEEIVLQLLKGYQVFTQACGNLPLLQPRDAFLANLCEFALASAGQQPPGELDTSPRGAAGLPPADRIASPRGSIAAAGAGEAAAEQGLVLAPKNVQSMRTLFNIAHRLSNVLGPAWALVLETMNTLDRILNSPRTTTQEVSAQSDESAMPSDLVILAAAASQLFECTRDMSREAVVSLLSGLRDVSMRNIPAISGAVGQAPKLFALNRMVEVLLYNIGRIYDLWAIFLSHVLEVINDPKPPVRATAIEALGRAIIGALGSLGPAPSGSGAAASAADPGAAAAAASESTGGVEHMLLVALEALYNADNERDVQAGVLRVLLNVLQRHGERLSDGWTPVFRLLAAAAVGEEDAINLAFQSLQLTCSDYMAAMPFARLRRCLEVAVLFSSQQADVNVSLTTISLLWNSADLFGKAAPAGHAGASRPGSALRAAAAAGDEESDTEVEAAVVLPVPASSEADESLSDEEAASPSSKRSQLAANLTTAQSEELLQMIFLALQVVSQDTRPEVRNSGVRTLFAVVVNQGPRLSRALWEQCLWEMLFPLLNHAYLMSATASRDEAESMVLGQSRGKEVRMMVHHSRNSEQKQWDETVVIALGGMARLLRAHLPAIVGMDRVAAGWEEMMVVVESSMAGGRKEVALAAITLLSAVLQAHGAITDIVSPAMWKRAMRALGVGVEAATSPSCMVPLSARTELLALIGLLYTTLRSRFDADDTAQVFVWVEKFSRNPWSDDDAANSAQVVMGMPPVQKSALAMLPKLAPTHLPQLYPEYIYSIVRLLRPEHVIEQWQEQQQEAAERTAAAAAAQQQFSIPAEPPAVQQPGSASTQPPAAAGGAAPVHAELANGGGVTLASHASGTVKQPSGQVAQARFALTSAFLEKVIEQLVAVYRDAPLAVRATTFASVVSGLARCMEVRYIVYHESLWRISAQAFNVAVPAGLPGLAAAAAAGEDTSPSWEALADAFETFLLGANVLAATQPGSHSYEPAMSMASDASMLRAGTPSGESSASRSASQGQEVTSRPPADPGAAAAAAVAVAAPPPPVALAGAAAPTPLSPQQARQDAELEVAVLDCLTDVVLTQCASAPADMKQRLIATVDAGASRPKELSVPQATTSSNFGHVCIRKMYVLCSRGGGGTADPDGCLLEVSRLALPVFMSRCDAVLRAYAEDQARVAGASSSAAAVGPGRTRLDEVLCILEVLASMSLAPAVADAALPPSEFLTQMVRNLRSRPEVAARGRERTHLLLLYSALCGCITCKEPRVREMARDVLLLAGAELGLGVPLPALPSRQASRQLSLGSAGASAAGGRLSSVDESAALL